MKKLLWVPAVLLCICLCLTAAAEEAEYGLSSFPGYTCYPMVADNEEYPGHFCVDCPADWDCGDVSEVYGIPLMMAFADEVHVLLVAEIDRVLQSAILAGEEHPIMGFAGEGMQAVRGQSTENSRILEQYVLNGLEFTRVEMVGQGFEMIWILDRDAEAGDDADVLGDLWFFMYPTDPNDEGYTKTIADMAASFTAAFPVSAGTAEAGDFEYTVTDGEVRIDKYIGNSVYVRMPDQIEDMPVTEMGDGVFYETDVRSVWLPDTVRTMGTYTFGGCPDLTFVKLPAGIDTLPTGTFESCFRLVDPGLQEGLKKIDNAAFWGNNYLTMLSLPASLEEIEDGAFVMANYLGWFFVPEENGHFVTDDSGTVLFSADGTLLIRYSFANRETGYTVPDGVKQIYSECFYRAPLTEVILPDGLEYIGYNAFGSTDVTELHIPASVKAIGVMQNVSVGDDPEKSTLTNVTIGESLQTIYGVPGSAAESFAAAQGLTFVPEE